MLLPNPNLCRLLVSLVFKPFDCSEETKIARFLNAATFGATASDVAEFPGPLTKQTASAWIASQFNASTTSHRAYYRTRLNAAFQTPTEEYLPTKPCDKGSRWRRYAFSKEDRHLWWDQDGRTIGVHGDGPYVITFDGFARTTVSCDL